jgi:anti-sigma factor RsiW
MTCERIRAMIDDVARDRATEPERAAVAEHVSECPSCARSLEEARALASLVSLTAPRTGLDDSFTRATLSRIQSEKVRPSVWSRIAGRVSAPALGGVALAAAACLVLVLASPTGFRHHSGTGSSVGVESAPPVAEASADEDLNALESLDLAQAADEEADPFVDSAVVELSRAGASRYMVAGLGL